MKKNGSTNNVEMSNVFNSELQLKDFESTFKIN